MKSYKLNIHNLDCANCAKKVEDYLNKNEKIRNAILNFTTSKLYFESDENFSLEEINSLIKKVEPDAYVLLESNKSEKSKYSLKILILGISLAILSMIFKNNTLINLITIILAYLLLLYKPAFNAFKSLVKSKTLNENALITISCLGAFLLGKHLEGIMVVTLYLIGKILEEKAVNNSRNSIKDLINLKQDFANIKMGNEIKKIDVHQVKAGDILVIKKGEKIPVDGLILEGETFLDTSMLTGESEEVKAQKGDNVLSGTINLGDVIEIKAENEFSNSTVSRILNLLEEASNKKAKTETFISKASKVYTPIVLILSILSFIVLTLIFKVPYFESIYRALTFLVISCPCAIAISVPLSYFSGIGVASKNGILIKGSNYLDNLGKLKKIVFDKTGTLTEGSFSVKKIEIFDKNYSKDEIIDILVKGESFSNHPIAKSILKLTNKSIDQSGVSEFKEIEGNGIFYNLDGKKVIIGTQKACNCNEIAVLHLNIDGKHVASIDIDDGIKKSANSAIEELKNQDLKVYMFTGDKRQVALEISEKLGINDVKFEMLPTDKYSEYEKISNTEELAAFCGDGINDAPVLKRADIGISMGNIGSESAIEASDVVLISDDLNKIPLSIKISKYTKYIIKQNLLFAMFVKLSILILSVLGLANMWMAVFADTGVTLIAILNTLRILNKFKILKK